ncbi:Serine/threonine protein kinase [Handroanthus impetiginosus]|uniref:Serine/threonine protein kinase n=1 Tax=Handroanthus impetiginosus TaxID=429701 RepID=A0A2G9HMG6_9LAMI|nr:Serine/threonine protein kinase [Handroanthus impetiginosus]
MKLLIGIFLIGIFSTANGRCSRGCDVALASYYVPEGSNMSFISRVTQTPISRILSYNPQIPNQDLVSSDNRVNVPFRCDCLAGGEYLGHVFTYTSSPGDTYELIAGTYYANLTTARWMERNNRYPAGNIPDGVALNVTVNCSCGDRDVAADYALFVTYPLREGESLESVAAASNLSADLVRRYNPTANFSAGRGLVYIPSRGFGASLGITVDTSIEFSYKELANATNDFSIAHKIGEGGFGAVYYAELRGQKAAIKKMDMRASKEFLAELKVLTHVHHLNLHIPVEYSPGECTNVVMCKIREAQVVHLIGYCVQRSLFLVYEYIDNGNLSEHLRYSSREPLPWSTRVQIALDSARGLEYIHEHTVSVYVHRDIKPANILIDKNFHAKVADFGLTKLTEVGNSSLSTGRLVGTFGYMPPEYAKHRGFSSKVDVYAFGVVLYELISAKEAIVKTNGSSAEPRSLVALLISAKEAIVKTNGSSAEPRSLVALFEETFDKPEPTKELSKLIDPRLGDSYSLDLVLKMAQLAKLCTHENPQLRPNMKSIVVALMALSSLATDLDVGSL